MPKFWASSSCEDSDSDIDSYSDGSASATSKFWTPACSSSGDGSVRSATAGLATPPPAAVPSPGSDLLSTPTGQPILPVDDPPEAWRRINPRQAFLALPTRTGPTDPSSFTRLACVSDTHGYHRSVPVPPCDVLIHGGDFTNYGEPDMVAEVSAYFSELRETGVVREGVVCVAGNHELTFQPDRYDRVRRRFARPGQVEKHDARSARRALSACTYLEDEIAAVGRGGVRVYGSPWQPEFGGRAFNAPRSRMSCEWERIPAETDALVTHGPPLGRGDVTEGGQRVGCVSLMREVQGRVRPRLHVFGHIHDSHGVTYDGATMYVNASSVSRNYTQINRAVVVDLPHDPDMPALLVKPHCRLDADGLTSWLRRSGYKKTAASLEDLDGALAGSDFIQGSHNELCCRLLIHRDNEAMDELKQAMSKLWSESFG